MKQQDCVLWMKKTNSEKIRAVIEEFDDLDSETQTDSWNSQR